MSGLVESQYPCSHPVLLYIHRSKVSLRTTTNAAVRHIFFHFTSFWKYEEKKRLRTERKNESRATIVQFFFYFSSLLFHFTFSYFNVIIVVVAPKALFLKWNFMSVIVIVAFHSITGWFVKVTSSTFCKVFFFIYIDRHFQCNAVNIINDFFLFFFLQFTKKYFII